MMKDNVLKQKIRCAVYTRKSTEDGLEMAFNSLDAQREAGMAYIQSQRHEGWYPLDDQYDDGGYSGGNMERPALARLLQDVQNDKVDCIVVYKIDRLTRKLADFSKLIEILNDNEVTFVSVTQQFSTTSAMGKLTLNILLSFAEFERDLTGERIRDKIAASRKKGMWMGGNPSLGYDIQDRKLVINQSEAELVNHIFTRYQQMGSVTHLVNELNEAGYTTKLWISQSGNHFGGKSFNKKVLYKMLRNQIYIGKVVHKGQVYPGEHEAIISPKLFDQVQAIMNGNRLVKSNLPRLQTPALLKGLLFNTDGRAMTPTHTKKSNGKRYHYYVSTKAVNSGYDACPFGQIPAGDIEEIVTKQVHSLLHAPELVMETWRVANEQEPITEAEILTALKRIDPIWETLFPIEQARIIQLTVAKVVVCLEGIDLHLRLNGIRCLANEVIDQAVTTIDENDHQHFITHIPVKFRRRDWCKRIEVPDDMPEPKPDKSPENAIVRALVRAHRWQQWMDNGKVSSFTEIAKKEKVPRPYVVRTLKLTSLAPDIQEAILNDKIDPDIRLDVLYDLPVVWNEQRDSLGISTIET